MFAKNITIIFAILGIAIVLGSIGGVASGVFLQSYALLGIGSGLILLIFILLVITIIFIEYQHKNEIASNFSSHMYIFSPRLTRREKTLLTFAASLIFTVGCLLGILCELLLKAISVSKVVHIIIGAVFIFIIFILLIVLLILELKVFVNSKKVNRDPYPVSIKPVIQPKSQDTNDNRVRYIDNDTRYTRQNSFLPRSNTSKPPSTIQKEYQKLLNPSSRFYVNEKVFVNDNNIAEIIEADGVGNYRIQYLDNGLMDFKSGSALRKALPLVS